MVIGSNPIRPKKTLDKKSNPVKLKTMKDLLEQSHLIAPTYHWMLNGYAKHTELTQEELELYFKEKEKE